MIVTGTVCNKVVFVKYCPDFNFCREIMQDKSNIIFQVMFYMDGYFNNSKKLKNTFLKSSYNAMN